MYNNGPLESRRRKAARLFRQTTRTRTDQHHLSLKAAISRVQLSDYKYFTGMRRTPALR